MREPGLGSSMPHDTEIAGAKYLLLKHHRNRHPKIVPEPVRTQKQHMQKHRRRRGVPGLTCLGNSISQISVVVKVIWVCSNHELHIQSGSQEPLAKEKNTVTDRSLL